MTPAWVQSTAGAAVAVALGAADAWQFHTFSKDLDLVLILGGLAALGVHVAYTTGKASN